MKNSNDRSGLLWGPGCDRVAEATRPEMNFGMPHLDDGTVTLPQRSKFLWVVMICGAKFFCGYIHDSDSIN